MRPLRLLVLLWIGLWQFCPALFGAEFHLTNGDILRGEAVSFDDDGLIVRLEIGQYSPRIGWSKLTQETLKDLAKNPEAAKLVEPFIDIPPVQKEKAKAANITLKPVPRAARVENPSFFSSFATPAGVMILVVILLGNLYAAYEIAHYRHRPVALVCGLSVVFPILAPALFLTMPPAYGPEDVPGGIAEPAVAAQAAGKSTTGSLAKAPMGGGLSVAQAKAGSTSSTPGLEPQSYKRGEFTFNRRFFETKFPSFFRVVPNDADLVLIIRSAKEEHVVKRITRITSNEMHLQPVRGGSEVMVPFAEVTEVHVRHKDAKV